MNHPSFNNLQQPDLLPTALFSPSKAAAQRAQAADWVNVDSWLSSKYQGRSVPAFERNEDTLKALQALVAVNERADEERDTLLHVQKEALERLKRRKEELDGDGDLHKGQNVHSAVASIISHLDPPGQTALRNLSTLSVTLEMPTNQPPTPLALASSLITLTQTSHELTQHLANLQNLQLRLSTDMTRLHNELQELRSPKTPFQPSPQLGRQTLEWSRGTKQLRGKLQEYADRLQGLQAAASRNDVSIEAIVAHEQEIESIKKRAMRLEKEVELYKGLPRDKESARREVDKVERELERLKRDRDELFAQSLG